MLKYSVILFVLFFGTQCFSQIRITHPKFDFGNVFEENGVVYANFELENPYFSDTIKINSVETSCGCTAILTKDTIIYPRSIVDLKVSYDPKGRVGLFQKSIKIKTTTGTNEKNELYLQIVGNVVPKVKNTKSNPKLIEYKVAPIYFYPITEFDTSYLDFNFIVDFVNDLTYEADYFQFSKVGFEVKVRGDDKIEALEYLIRYSKYKLLKEIKDRGYQSSQLFFAEPIFVQDSTIPAWSLAQIKVFSVNFNQDELSKSTVKLTLPNIVDNNVYLLSVKSNQPIQLDSIEQRINFKMLNKRLMEDSVLILEADYKTPENYSIKKQLKFKKEVYNLMYKSLHKTSGIKKSELIIHFDSVSTHSSTQFYFKLWQKQDLEEHINVAYQIKEDVILSPLLPTYKMKMTSLSDSIKTQSNDFSQFWNSLITYKRASSYMSIILESSVSHSINASKINSLQLADKRAKQIKKIIQAKFHKATGHFIRVIIKNVISGLPYSSKKEFSTTDFSNYDYIKLIPIYKNDRQLPVKPVSVRPYVVNYDYYFIGIDTSSFVFKKFADYLIYEIQTKGFVELKTESSASHIPVDRHKSNIYMAYKHIEESKKRLFDYLKKRLVDPNRIIISDERILEQGIPYSKKIPIVRYKSYQYVTFVPVKYISN